MCEELLAKTEPKLREIAANNAKGIPCKKGKGYGGDDEIECG
jgi:hypothetical protein